MRRSSPIPHSRRASRNTCIPIPPGMASVTRWTAGLILRRVIAAAAVIRMPGADDRDARMRRAEGSDQRACWLAAAARQARCLAGHFLPTGEDACVMAFGECGLLFPREFLHHAIEERHALGQV